MPRFSVACLFLLSACAGPEIVEGRSEASPACGPEVTLNSVRSLKLLDEYASLGREATLRIAEERVGPIELLDGSEAVGYWYPRINETAAKMGCDVVLHVRRTKARSESGGQFFHVIFARRSPGGGEK